MHSGDQPVSAATKRQVAIEWCCRCHDMRRSRWVFSFEMVRSTISSPLAAVTADQWTSLRRVAGSYAGKGTHNVGFAGASGIRHHHIFTEQCLLGTSYAHIKQAPQAGLTLTADRASRESDTSGKMLEAHARRTGCKRCPTNGPFAAKILWEERLKQLLFAGRGLPECRPRRLSRHRRTRSAMSCAFDRCRRVSDAL